MAVKTSPPATAAGVVVLAVSPVPSLPPFSPQQYAAPAAVIAQVCAVPAPMCANVSSPFTGTGTRLLARAPLPSCPWPPEPQHHAAPPVARPQA